MIGAKNLCVFFGIYIGGSPTIANRTGNGNNYRFA
jgi:hypothetical protein